MKVNIRRVVVYFIYAEFLDLLTTMIGLSLGMSELNPLVYKFGWDTVIILKVVITISLAIVLQIKHPKKADFIIPWLALVPVMWNSAMLVMTW